MRHITKPAALLAVLALVLAACGEDGGGETTVPETVATTVTVPTTTAEEPTETTEGETTETTEGEPESAGAQSDILIDAFEEEPQELGLDPIEPPDYAFDIVEVDTSEYAMEPGPRRVAFAIQAPEFSWPATYNDAVTARMDEAYPDSELILSPTGLGEADTQVGTIEDLLVQQPDILIITPLTDVAGPVERAAAQGTPVVLCTGTADTDAYVTRVDRDNILNGKLGAEWIAREMGYEGNVILLGGPAGVPTAEARLQGATEVFDGYPDIEILGQEYTNWDAADGQTAMQSFLTQFDDIDAVWTDGAGQAVGAIEAYKDDGREIPPFAAEPLNGFLRVASEEGFPFVAVGYPPSHSSQCLDAAMDILDGETVPSFINVEVPTFTHEELDEWYRPNCIDDLWLPTPLTEEELVDQELCEPA
ncbi:MAG: substrate-binding domain-containing protein [Actinomycetota bacterium]